MKQDWNRFWERQPKTSSGSVSWSKRRILRILSRHTSPGMSVLDAGSGSGFFSRWFLDQNCVVDSLDYSETALSMTRAATEGRSRRYLQADLLNPVFPLSEPPYDLIFTDGLFEHFSGPQQKSIMALFRRIKNPNGLVVTFVPNRYSPWQLMRPFLMPGVQETPFTIKALRALHAELETVETGGLNVLPCPNPFEKGFGALAGMLLYAVVR